ncbi:hypothetical protein [Streptomyces sp. NRRL S-1022]|uniref:hypothetical protein n=1 Tax=Streptomyces sp. NRRL S-1022 TaxID=1463880 RepID=UPI000A59C274|nr:hypothetical protein [Streptomyces sp. NRRL S-1022]
MPEALAAPYAGALGSGPAGLGLCAPCPSARWPELFAGSRLPPAARARVGLPLLRLCLLPYLGYALRPGLAVPSAAPAAVRGRVGVHHRAWTGGSCEPCRRSCAGGP